MSDPGEHGMPPAGLAPLFTRLLCGLYEVLLLVGLVMLAGFFLVPLGQALGLPQDIERYLRRAWILLLVGAYFVWFWTHGGQTLPMKTWHIRVCGRDGRGLSLERATLRALLVLAGWGLAGAHLVWALVDREGLFLHDRMLGTRIVNLPRPAGTMAG